MIFWQLRTDFLERKTAYMMSKNSSVNALPLHLPNPSHITSLCFEENVRVGHYKKCHLTFWWPIAKISLTSPIECFHMTSRRPCWRSEIFFWELNSIFMKIIPFVLVCKCGYWSRERKHCIVINVPTRASLALETKGLLFLWLAHLITNNKNNVCKQISSLYCYQVDGVAIGSPLGVCHGRYHSSFNLV